MIKKAISIADWAGTMSANLFGWLTAKVVYPIVYTIRDKEFIQRKPFWFYLDDEDGHYGTDWFREALRYGHKTDWWSRFKIAYEWLAIRNPAWNLQASLVPKDGEKVLVETWGKAIKDGNEVDPYLFANFKYENVDGIFKNNKGDFLSLKHSAIGKRFTWYKVGDRLYWRLSYANKAISKMWIEFHLGISNDRYTFRLKFKWSPKIKQ
jgi:hypothetical protein